MARVWASRTSGSNDDNVRVDSRRTRDSSISPPTRFERIKKPVGSKVLVLGRWVEVRPGDDDAA